MTSIGTSSLEVFLLALIDGGIATPYAMRERAALSVGATLPALRRLEHQGLVERGKTGPRNKTVFKLTAAGRKALGSGVMHIVKEFLAAMPGEIESILRVAALAAAQGKRPDAARLLQGAAADRGRRAEALKKEVAALNERSGRGKAPPDVASVYRSMLAVCSSAQRRAESKALTVLSSRLK